ncbi:hypothetical protein FACS1894141_6250 [Spirochaetia bacterium]|nr:hypothetical protein FACS1894141_6250 [Spirochaetia bacterium]
MNQSLSQAIAGCTITGKMQTLSAALMTGNRITRAALNAFTEARNGNAAKLAAALDPTVGIYAAIRAMDPCRVMDLRSPAERAISHIQEKRESITQTLDAIR